MWTVWKWGRKRHGQPTRLGSHQRGVIYGVAETGVPGPVSQWGSAEGGRLGKSENPTYPTIPMLMCPSVFMPPLH